ncbi:MAG: hypothetical protein V1738_03960 [Patescibacteria group bacterium]
MFLAVHGTVGAIVGNAVGEPITAFSLNFILHFLLDMIPHGDQIIYEQYKQKKKLRLAMMHTSLDAAATLSVLSIIFLLGESISGVGAAAGVIGGLLPDFLVGLYELIRPAGSRWSGQQLTKFNDLHMRNHMFLIQRLFHRDIPLHYGYLMQAVGLVVILKILL